MLVVETLTRSNTFEEVNFVYFYRLVKGRVLFPFNDKSLEVQSYGIEVERQDIYNGNTINIERDYIENISPQRYKVHNLLRLLYDGEVSPIHLVEVLGDYVDEYISDFDDILKEISTI